MTDDQLRELLAQAHRDDAPPPFAPPRRAARGFRLELALVAAMALALALVPGRRPAAPARLDVEISAPLDFLLDVPGASLLRDTPRFDLKGTLP